MHERPAVRIPPPAVSFGFGRLVERLGTL